jgi:preprotein translocase subunit SecF
MKAIEDLQRFLDSLPGVDKSISWLDYAKLVRYATNQYQPEYYSKPQFAFEVRMIVNNLKMSLGEELLRRFVDNDFTKTSILLRTHIINSKDFLETKEKITNYLDEHFPGKFSYGVTGLSMAIAHSSHELTTGQVQSLGIALALIFIIMVLLFMSFKVGLIAILPNLFPIVLIFGLMGWLGIELSMITSLIASIAIGIAVDDTIHYLTRYNMEFKKDWDKRGAMERTVLNVGRPIIFTSICITAGFSVLMLSSFQPTAVFGKLMIVTMACALLADLFLLPSLMLHVELVTIWDLLLIKLGHDPQERIPLFKGMSRGQVRYIMLAGFLETYPEGEVIFRQNDPSDSMYAIVSGEVKVVDHSGSKEIYIDKLEQGDVVGEMGFIRSQPRSATVVANVDTELLKINKRMLKRLQLLYPPTAQKFFMNLLAILCNRLEATTRRFIMEEDVKLGAP